MRHGICLGQVQLKNFDALRGVVATSHIAAGIDHLNT
jgi:hypothetical protein